MAYFEAEKPTTKKRGRPRKYSEKVKIAELFDHPHLFSKVECSIYGKVEEFSIVSLDLLWKPTAGLIRFALAVTSRSPIILMCTDFQQDAVKALELYCARARIETMFDMLKNVMGVFNYRFWTKGLPRHSRKPRKNKYLKKPMGQDQMKQVRSRFAVWKQFKGFLRTKSRHLPSERTVKSVVGNLFIKAYLALAPGLIMRKIKSYKNKQKRVDVEHERSNLEQQRETSDIET